MPSIFRNEKWFVIGSLLVLLGSAFIAYYFYSSWKTLNVVNLPVPDCDLAKGTCYSKLDSGEQVALTIKPTHMPVLTSVLLEVKTDNISVKKMFIYFKGAEMNMGEFRYTLLRQKDGIYSTQTILPTCIHDDMIWHAVVHIEANNKHYSAPFVFVNHRPDSA
ncbi:MAG: hypothetical protein JSR17_07975 [Proteobacteria bacterium]|nr:hypothetical protein [Pseudomonadota bacterium]